MSRKPAARIDSKEALANRLKKSRINAGLSTRELATKVGCSPTYISRIENAQRVPSPEILGKLSWTLGVSEEWLSGEDISHDPAEMVHMYVRRAKVVLSSEQLGSALAPFVEAFEEFFELIEAEIEEERRKIRAAIEAGLEHATEEAADSIHLLPETVREITEEVIANYFGRPNAME